MTQYNLIQLSLGESERLRNLAFDLRKRVFVDEQGFDMADEFDKYDNESIHLVATEGSLETATKAVGTLRFMIKPDNYGKVGRVAVDHTMRGKRIGSLMIGFIHEHAKSLGLAGTCLSSQFSKQKFYNKFGYVAVGDQYIEDGAPHILMELHFSSK